MVETPNIVFVHLDQWHHRAVSALGERQVATPNIDRVLAAGMHLREVHAANPVCCPARASWMTGRMSSEHRVIANPHPMVPELPDMASWIHRHAGYETVHTGKWHVPGRRPEDCYERMLRHKGWVGEHVDRAVTDTALGYLQNRQGDRPFLLSVGLINPHDCCYVSGANGGVLDFRLAAEVPTELPPLPDNFTPTTNERVAHWTERDWRFYRYCYFRQMEMVDAQVGRLFDAVQALPDAANTLFLLTSDHGDGLAHHGNIGKGYLQDESLRVPTMAVWPGRIAPGSTCDALGSQVDIPATICDLAGAPPLPQTPLARSWQPLFGGAIPADWRDHVVAENGEEVAIRDARYKSFFTEDDGLTQLYDLQADPLETRNLAAQGDLIDVCNRHRDWLCSFARTVVVPANDDDLDEKQAALGKSLGGIRMQRVRRWYPALAEGASP